MGRTVPSPDISYSGVKEGGVRFKSLIYSDLCRSSDFRAATRCGQRALRHPAPAGLAQRSIETDFSGGVITSNGGVTLLRRADERLDLTPRLAACFTNHRRPELVVHDVETLVLQRLYGLARAY